MIDPAQLGGPLAACVAGLVTSLHCAGMCGPLACAACSSGCTRSANTAAMIYHGTRVSAYLLVGLLAGWLGGRISGAFSEGATRGMTWVFVIFFGAVALGLDKYLRLPRGGAVLSRVFENAGTLGPFARAGTLGALTPLLPCAPLYLVVGAAALSGSAGSGALLMGAFGLGTVPLLFAMQNRLAAIQKRWSPRRMDYLRRGLALVSVAVLLIRGTYTASTGCPMCH